LLLGERLEITGKRRSRVILKKKTRSRYVLSDGRVIVFL
jgi:hypothetical protein